MPELFSHAEWRLLARTLRLTPRQVQICRLLCLGLQTKQIAGELGLSSHTVRMHKQGLFGRLRVRDRIGVPVRLVLAARRISACGQP